MDARHERFEQEHSEPSHPQKLSPRGVGAMQGTVEEVADSPSPVMDEGQVEQISLEDRHRVGIDYAVDNAEINERGIVAYRKISGAVGEGVYLSANGGSVGLVSDLNAHLGNHNKIFDGSSSEELASIKTYVTGRSEPYGRYARALREMIGQVEPQKLGALSHELLALKNSEPEKWAAVSQQLPSKIRDATDPADLRERLIDEAVMRIPADQVKPARAYVARAATKRPELYGLDPALPPGEIASQAHLLAGKIRPLAPDVSAHDMRLMAGHAYRKRFETGNQK